MKRPSVLVVGVGSIGERHLRCLKATGRANLSFCEIAQPLRRSIADRYGIGSVFDRYESALESQPDAVVICTPAHLHIPMAQAAAERGVHLLIEKPLSTGDEGVDDLMRTVARRGLVASVAYVYRAHPALATMRAALLQGRFGRPLQFVAQCGQHFPLYRPAYREIYYKDRATGGGAVQDALTHIVNAAEWLVGPVDRVTADLDHLALPGVTVEDTVHILTRHGPVMGCFSLNQHQAPNETQLTVVCSSGVVRFLAHSARWQWCVEPGEAWHDQTAQPLERDDWFIAQSHAFLDALEGKAQPLCTLAQARQTLAVNLAVLRSAQTGQWQVIRQPEVAA
jgi:predicted dehydrogenase